MNTTEDPERAEPMTEELIVKHCAPTLAGMKTGNIISYPYKDDEELARDMSELNSALNPKGIYVLPLKRMHTRTLVYIYRPGKLKNDIKNEQAQTILRSLGYSDITSEGCIRELILRLRMSDTFPHEIGLFIGYPPEDVAGFINKKPCLFTGKWKVYSNAEKARKTFRKYDKCQRIYSELWDQGRPFEKLIVAV